MENLEPWSKLLHRAKPIRKLFLLLTIGLYCPYSLDVAFTISIIRKNSPGHSFTEVFLKPVTRG